MAEIDPSVLNPIYELRQEKMISPKNGKPITRVAHFLKPCSESPTQAAEVLKTSPLLSEIISHTIQLQKLPVNLRLIGWKKPTKDWESWFFKIMIKYGTLWMEVGILDGIMSSLHEIPCNHDLILGLSEFWCSETNTFVFPWGEATITLEDTMILGGLPILGEPLGSVLEEGEFADVIVEELNKVRKKLSSGKDKKATYGAWLKYFMEKGDEGELEHAAFLSYWLSRFVFPERTIEKQVFPIAALLSLRTPVALSPSVLASIYKNLSLLAKKTADVGDSESTICVPGPFQLVQLWACERFPLFGAESAKPLIPGDKRVARWDKVDLKVTLPHVRSALRLVDNFLWRPYTASLENWDKSDSLSYHEKTEQYVTGHKYLDDGLQCYHRFIHCRMLVGIDGCREKYQPHRVAMQFGLDQDIPGHFVVSEPSDNVGFYVPPRDIEPGMTERYLKWWKECTLARKVSISHVLQRCKGMNPIVNRIEAITVIEKDDLLPSWKKSDSVQDSVGKPLPTPALGIRSSNGDPDKQKSKTSENGQKVMLPSRNVLDSVQDCVGEGRMEDSYLPTSALGIGSSNSEPWKQNSKASERRALVDPKAPPGFKEKRSQDHSSIKKNNDDGKTVSHGQAINEGYDDLDHVPLALRIRPTAPTNLEIPKAVKGRPIVAPECRSSIRKQRYQIPRDKDKETGMDSWYRYLDTVPFAWRLSLAADEPSPSNREVESSDSVTLHQSPFSNHGQDDNQVVESLSDAAGSESKVENGKEVDKVGEANHGWKGPVAQCPTDRKILMLLSRERKKAQKGKLKLRKDGDCVDNPTDMDGSPEDTPASTVGVLKRKIEMLEGFLGFNVG